MISRFNTSLVFVPVLILSCTSPKKTFREDHRAMDVQNYFKSMDTVAAMRADTVVQPDSIINRIAQDSPVTRLREDDIAEWGARVQTAVELSWILPKQMLKQPYRAVALIRIGREGGLLKVTWITTSPSPPFNNLAAKALKKVKRFPPFPPTLLDSTLEIQYEFVTRGKRPGNKKLQLRSVPD